MKRMIIFSSILALIGVGALIAVASAQGPYGGRMMGSGGMMGGYGRGVAPSQAITPTVPYGGMMWGYGPMWGYGVMGGLSHLECTAPQFPGTQFEATWSLTSG